jgi:hypothetical protein
VAGLVEPIRAAPWAEALLLVLLGSTAAVLSASLNLDLKVPGHAILRSVFPFCLGLALVPRRGAGTVMGVAALATLLARSGGDGPGWGAATSLALTGPALDLAARGAGSGRSIYLALVLAGTAANLVAFAFRLGAKLLSASSGRPVASWWPEAIATYALCGMAAGAISAAVWFRLGSRAEPGAGPRAG